MSIDDLKTAISRLSPEEVNSLRDWFDEFLADRWDQQIEADILAGRLDAAGRKAIQDFKAGLCSPLA